MAQDSKNLAPNRKPALLAPAVYMRAHPAGVPSRADVNMIKGIADELRELAQRCTRLARDCPHQPTAHGLEELALELMVKAQDLEQKYDQ